MHAARGTARLCIDAGCLRCEPPTRGMDDLAARVEQRRHGRLREPVDLELWNETPELARDRNIAPGVSKTDRRGQCDRPTRAGTRGKPLTRFVPRGLEPRCHAVDQPVDEHGMPGTRDVASADDANMLGVCELGEREPGVEVLAVVAVALDHDHRAADAATELCDLVAGLGDRLARRHQQHLDRPVESIRDRVLDLLRRVRLRKHVRVEELEETAIVAPERVGADAVPGVVPPRIVWREMRHAGRERNDREDAIRMQRGDLHGGPDAVDTDADKNRGPRSRRVHHVEAVIAPPAVEPRSIRIGGVGIAVAAAVVRKHAVAAREVMDLALPKA